MQTIFLFVLFLSPLSFGSGFVWGYTLLECSILLLASSLFLQRSFFPAALTPAPEKNRSIFVLLFIWALFIFFQTIPLPVEFVEKFSPHRIQIVEAFSPVRAIGTQISFSLGSYAMIVELGKQITYIAIFFIAWNLFRDQSSIRNLGAVCAWVGGLIALVGLMFHAVHPDRAYGVFQFWQSAPMTPFLNKNHFANYMVMTLPVTAAMIFLSLSRSSFSAQESLRDRLVWFSTREATQFFVLSASLILQGFALSQTASRGGTLALMVAAVFMSSVLWLRKMGIKTFLIFSVSLCLGIALFCLLFFPVLFAKFQTLTQTDLAVYFRLSRWQDTWNMFRDFSWFGIGVGGFQELYPLYKSIPEKPIFDQFRFFYAENEYIQALAELGIVGCGILSALVIVLARSVVRMWLRVQSKTLFWISLGLASGAAGMLAHSFFDFPMHIPSNMALFSVFGGVLWRMSRSYAAMPSGIKEEREEVLAPSRASWARRRIFGSGVFVLIVLWIALPFLWRQWITEHYYLKAKKKLDAMSIHNQVHLPELEASQGFLEQAVRWDSRQARIQYEFARLYLFRSNLVAGASSSLPSSGGEDGLRLAEQFLLGAIQRFPLDGEYFCLLGQLYERQNKKESARTYYERAIYLEPQNAYYKFNLARNRLSAGDLLFSRELCRQILEYNPSYIAAIFEFIPQYPGWITEKNWLELIPDGENHWLVAKRLMDYLDEKGNSSLAALIQTTMNQWQIQP